MYSKLIACLSLVERYKKIKNWLTAYGKFVINERQDDNFHFSFFIWSNSKRGILLPMTIGLLKHLVKERECVLLQLGWNVDKKSSIVKVVINDPAKIKDFVSGFENLIDSRNYLLDFLPNQQVIDAIRISRFIPIDLLNKKILFKEIIDLWFQYGKYISQMQKCFGRSNIANPEDYR